MLPPKDHSRFLEYWTCSSANTLPNYSRDQSRIVLFSFHSMVIEMVNRGILAHDIAASVSIRGSSRYDTPVIIPTIEDEQNLLLAADKLADSKNAQIARSWERYRPMLYLAADSGMLPQQYVVVPRFNVLGNGVKVDRALEMGGYKISVTKTPAGRRFIDLSQYFLPGYPRLNEASPNRISFDNASSFRNFTQRRRRRSNSDSGLGA